jgi:hypothetical protein
MAGFWFWRQRCRFVLHGAISFSFFSSTMDWLLCVSSSSRHTAGQWRSAAGRRLYQQEPVRVADEHQGQCAGSAGGPVWPVG